MSQQNVDAFRSQAAAWNRDDIQTYLDAADPDIELFPGPTRVAGGVFVGHAGIREWWSDVHGTFEELTVDFEEVRDLGDTVLGLGRLHGRSKSGVPIDTDYAAIARFRDGLSIWARSFSSHQEGLDAAGQSE